MRPARSPLLPVHSKSGKTLGKAKKPSWGLRVLSLLVFVVVTFLAAHSIYKHPSSGAQDQNLDVDGLAPDTSTLGVRPDQQAHVEEARITLPKKEDEELLKYEGSSAASVSPPGASPVSPTVTASGEPSLLIAQEVGQPLPQPSPVGSTQQLPLPSSVISPVQEDTSLQTLQQLAPDSIQSPSVPVTAASTPDAQTSPVVAAPITIPDSFAIASPPLAAVFHDDLHDDPDLHRPEELMLAVSSPVPSVPASGLYTLSAMDIDGHIRELSEFAGKVTLVVNVASACGFTDENYKGLTATYDKYHTHGLEILAFPCNQFGAQEPGNSEQIKEFCSSRYHVTFPIFQKVDVNGPHTHPVFEFLKRNLPVSQGGGGGTGPGTDLSWNFNKFLVNQQGQPVKLFYHNYDVAAVENDIYKLLSSTGLYSLSAVDIDGRNRQLSEFGGKVTLVVNVASACGFTDENYRGLTATYEKYRSRGFEILAFPCNQFGAQEPGNAEQIKEFCSSRYHVTFPIFEKVDVNGPHTHPVFDFLKRNLPASEGGGSGTGPGTDLLWNFNKFLVNQQGQPVKFFYQSYDASALEGEIAKLLTPRTV